MSANIDTSADGQRAVTPSLAEVEVPERPEDRKNALKQHRRRFWVQFGGWGLKILLAAASIPLLYAYSKYEFSMCGSHLFPTTGCRIAWGGSFLLPLLLLAPIIDDAFFHYTQKNQKFNVAQEKAQEFTNRRNMAEGYTDLFSIYVRTKRRSYHVMAWGIIAVLYGLVGLTVDVREAVVHGTILSLVYWVPPFLYLIAGRVLFHIAYKLGSEYLPGDVIVRHTLALIIYAVADIADPSLVRRQAAEEADQFVRNNPWWFYSK